MNPRPKNLPRLWCALQGLLPLESCLAAQRGELAWPPEPDARNRRSVTGNNEAGTKAQSTSRHLADAGPMQMNHEWTRKDTNEKQAETPGGEPPKR